MDILREREREGERERECVCVCVCKEGQEIPEDTEWWRFGYVRERERERERERVVVLSGSLRQLCMRFVEREREAVVRNLSCKLYQHWGSYRSKELSRRNFS